MGIINQLIEFKNSLKEYELWILATAIFGGIAVVCIIVALIIQIKTK